MLMTDDTAPPVPIRRFPRIGRQMYDAAIEAWRARREEQLREHRERQN
jgi:hypothetical protein